MPTTRLASRTLRSTVSRGRPSAQYAWLERKSWTASTSMRFGSSSSSNPSVSSRRTGGSLEPDHPLPLVGAGAVAVLRLSRAALPLRPPDPLQVVDLHHDEDHDRDEKLRPAHLDH